MTASTRTLRLHTRVLEQYDELIDLAGDPDVLSQSAPSVSAWSIGQQLEHLALSDHSVLNAVTRLMRSGKTEDSGRGPSAVGRLALLLGWIPRGRGKAPELAQPKDLDSGAVAPALSRERERCAGFDLGELEAATGTVAHFAFGHLTAVRWLRFVEIHHNHHRKIIDAIRRAS